MECFLQDKQNQEQPQITNHNIYVLLINQLSDDGNTIIEIEYGGSRIFLVSMYYNFNISIKMNLKKIAVILKFTEHSADIISMDSNTRSTTWQMA